MMSIEQTTQRPDRPIADVSAFFRSTWTLTATIALAVLVIDPGNFSTVIAIAAKAFAGTLPYILFAVTLIAWLKSAGADSMLAKAFEGRELRMILLAALFGGLAPFCSCEVVPFIAGLLAVGAPLSAIMAFWLSSPLIDPPTLLITAGALGWQFAIAKAIGAVLLGLMGGLAIYAVRRQPAFIKPLRPDAPGAKSCCASSKPRPEKPVWRVWTDADRRREFGDEFLANAAFLVKWLVFAYLLEALLIEYVPAELIGGLVGGNGITPIAISAVVGAPAYLNAYVAPPLVAGLMEQGMSAGAAMAFMTAGAVTSIPAMAAVWGLVNRYAFGAYVVLGMTGAIALGIAYQIVA